MNDLIKSIQIERIEELLKTLVNESRARAAGARAADSLRARIAAAITTPVIHNGDPITQADPFPTACVVTHPGNRQVWGSAVYAGGRIVLTAEHVVHGLAHCDAYLPVMHKDAPVAPIRGRVHLPPPKGGGNDLAAVVLDTVPEDVNQQVRLAFAKDLETLQKSGATVSLCGFGFAVAAFGSAGTKREARNVPLPMLDPKTPGFDPDFDARVEFFAGGKLANGTLLSICDLDSGCPVYAEIKSELVVLGVASRLSRPKGVCGHEGIFTRVDAYRDWICDLAEQAGTPICAPATAGALQGA